MSTEYSSKETKKVLRSDFGWRMHDSCVLAEWELREGKFLTNFLNSSGSALSSKQYFSNITDIFKQTIVITHCAKIWSH